MTQAAPPNSAPQTKATMATMAIGIPPVAHVGHCGACTTSSCACPSAEADALGPRGVTSCLGATGAHLMCRHNRDWGLTLSVRSWGNSGESRMRFLIVAASVSALALATGAFAQTPQSPRGA